MALAFLCASPFPTQRRQGTAVSYLANSWRNVPTESDIQGWGSSTNHFTTCYQSIRVTDGKLMVLKLTLLNYLSIKCFNTIHANASYYLPFEINYNLWKIRLYKLDSVNHPECSFPAFVLNRQSHGSSSHRRLQLLLIYNCLLQFALCERFIRVYTKLQVPPKC